MKRLSTDVKDFRNYFRMNESSYNKLLEMEMVDLFLVRKVMVLRKSLFFYERLALTLRDLPTGKSFSFDS